MSAVWSTIRLLISSGTRISKQRFPASIWNVGILRRFAGITAVQLLVSPKTSNASGCTSSNTLSTAIITLPMVSAPVKPAAFKK